MTSTELSSNNRAPASSGPLGLRPRAWLIAPEAFYYAEGAPRDPNPIHKSPIGSLIFGLWDLFHDQPQVAKRLLRRPIFAQQSRLSPFEWGTLKVGAKRVNLSATWPEDPLTPSPTDSSDVPLTQVTFDFDQLIQKQTNRAMESTNHPPLPHDLAWIAATPRKDGNVARRKFLDVRAALVLSSEAPSIPGTSPQGVPSSSPLSSEAPQPLWASIHRVLAVEQNQPQSHHLFHAELLLLLAHLHSNRPFTSEHRLWTSLKPCKMCAGLIAECLGLAQPLAQKHTRVYYRDFDEGRNARSTILTPRSEERKHFCPPDLWDVPWEAQSTFDNST